VHLFFLDDYETKLPHLANSSKRQNTEGRDPTQHQREMEGSPEAAQDSINDANISLTHYKLLFGGEVIGFQWNKNESSRSLVLQCVDWSNYWDYAYQFSNTGIFGPGRHAKFSGGATNLFTDFLQSKGSLIAAIMGHGKSANFPELKGMAAGIIRMMELVGGTYFPPPGGRGGRISGQNLFFSVAELRLRITHMVAVAESDPTTANLLRRAGFMGLFNRALGGLGSQISIRTIISTLTGVIFHETYAQPCPYFKPGGEVEPKNTQVSIGSSGRFGGLASSADGVATTLHSMADTARKAEDKGMDLKEIESIETRESLARQIYAVKNTVQGLIVSGAEAPAVVMKSLKAVESMISSGGEKSLQSLINGWRPLKPSNHVVLALERAAAEMSKIGRVQITGKKDGYTKSSRLNQHILRPDLWFGAPPRCNVLFPEDYSSLSYQRMFLQEPTRLLLKTNDEFFGEDFLFDKFYFAPQAGSAEGNNKDKARMRDVMNGGVLSHELFTGILPIFEKSGEFNLFASRSKDVALGSEADIPQAVKDGFAQRSANFMYFKHRFNSRQMSISGKFNPYLAVGFPGLVIDKYVDLGTVILHNQLREASNKGLDPLRISQSMGTNFLGNFTEVTHSISQQEGQGSTSIQCSYPRQPEESVEFLGHEDGDGTEETINQPDPEGKPTIRATDVAAITPPKLYGMGPNGGVITNVTDVSNEDLLFLDVSNTLDTLSSFEASKRRSKEAREDKYGGARRLPLFDNNQKHKVHPVMVPVSAEVTGGDLNSPEVTKIAGGSDVVVIFRAYRVEEEVPRFRRVKVGEKAFESLVHPGWYGDLWRTHRIGEVYQDFFGTGAITDPQAMTDGSQRVKVVGDEELAQASENEAASADGDPTADLLSFLKLDKKATIRDAVDFLVLTYSYIRQNNLNVDEFIRAYTWRPIATMADIFGSTDLAYDVDGQNVVAGVEGFHSKAFGPYENMFGLVGPEIKSILGIKPDDLAAQSVDTRKRKQDQVNQYASALLFSRGILG